MATFNEKACMDYHPFEGDFGDGERILKDHIGTAKSPIFKVDSASVKAPS